MINSMPGSFFKKRENTKMSVASINLGMVYLHSMNYKFNLSVISKGGIIHRLLWQAQSETALFFSNYDKFIVKVSYKKGGRIPRCLWQA